MFNINEFYTFEKCTDDIYQTTFIRCALKAGAKTGEDVIKHASEKYGAVLYTSRIEGWWGFKFINEHKMRVFLIDVEEIRRKSC